MAKNQVRMPSSTAGLTSFHDDSESKIHVKATQVVAVIVVMIILVLLLHAFGGAVFP